MLQSLSTLRFEKLTSERIPAILEIERLVNSAPWSERSFANEVDHRDGIFLVVLLGGEVIGYGGIWMIVDEAHITTLAIQPSQQRRGIGTQLLRDLLSRAVEGGMVCATLEVRSTNLPAIAMYQKAGFVVAATRRAYYPDNREDALVMWLYNLQVPA